MKQYLIALSLALSSLTASALTLVNCVPKTKHTPNATSGSQLRSAKSDTGRWVAYWCGAPDPANPAKWIWRAQTYAVLTKYSAVIEAAIQTAGGDVESFSVLTAVVNTPQVAPPVGSVDEYDWRMLRWSACRALAVKPYDVTLDADLPVEFCGAAPVPPPIGTPQSGWKATGATIFKYANGRLTSPTIRKATKDAACDGVTVVTAGTLIYQGLVGGAADEKTPCVKP